MMYKAVLQAVLLYGGEKWEVMETMMTVLEKFHHSIEINISGILVQRVDLGEWE